MKCKVFVWSVPSVPLTSTHRNANFDRILIVSVHVFSIPGSRLMCRVCKVSIVIRIFFALSATPSCLKKFVKNKHKIRNWLGYNSLVLFKMESYTDTLISETNSMKSGDN